MAYSFFDLILVATPLVLGVVLLSAWFQKDARGQEVPGPFKYPIVGNLFTPKRVYEQMAAVSKDFGPIYSLKLFSMKLVMITSVSIARELLETRSAIYSHRIPMKMAELCGFHEGMLFQSDSNKLRQGRKLVSLGLAQRELEKYRHVYAEHTVNFLASLLRAPEKFLSHIRKLPVGLTLELAYGYKVQGDDDPVVKKSEEWVNHFASATGFGDFLVNWFPILELIPSWAPGGSFKKVAAEWKKSSDAFTWDTFNSVKSAVERGDASPSVISKVLTDTPGVYDDDAIAYSAAQIMSGGADTTVCTLSTFMLAMILHPETQEKGKAELDRVIGSNRLPTINDWDDLPYVTSIVREVIRWHPSVPLLFRNPVEDDVYNGYVIPKDTMISINYWAMLHNKEFFPDDMTFRPERWADIEINKDNDPFEIAFGFGRRVCPGRASARELLFTVIAATLATFDISEAKDEQGNKIVPQEEFTDGGIVGPVPFQALIAPRSEHARQLIEHAVQGLH